MALPLSVPNIILTVSNLPASATLQSIKTDCSSLRVILHNILYLLKKYQRCTVPISSYRTIEARDGKVKRTREIRIKNEAIAECFANYFNLVLLASSLSVVCGVWCVVWFGLVWFVGLVYSSPVEMS